MSSAKRITLSISEDDGDILFSCGDMLQSKNTIQLDIFFDCSLKRTKVPISQYRIFEYDIFINLIACNKSNEELKEEDVVVENENNGEDTGDREDVIEETPSCTVNLVRYQLRKELHWKPVIRLLQQGSSVRGFSILFGAIDSTLSIQATIGPPNHY